MITSFKHKGLQRFYEKDDKSLLPPSLVLRISAILAVLDVADKPEAFWAMPQYRLHKLSGDLQDFWSVKVNANWRIILRFTAGEAFDVDLIDYH